jgi:hypothetical protein
MSKTKNWKKNYQEREECCKTYKNVCCYFSGGKNFSQIILSTKMFYRNVQQKWSTKMFFFAGGLLLYNYFIEEFDMTDSNQFYLNKIK